MRRVLLKTLLILRGGEYHCGARMTESMLETLASHAKSSSKEPGDQSGGSLRGENAGAVPCLDDRKHARSSSFACEEFI